MKTIFTTVIFLLFPLSELHSQADTLADVFPLSVGNEWAYHYNAKQGDNSDIYYGDSGIASYRIVDKIVEDDSTRWQFIRYRNVTHYRDDFFNHSPDTSYLIVDTSAFEIIESHTGRHRLYRTEHEYDIWDSAFPWSYMLDDSSVIFRYCFTDSLGEKHFETKSDSVLSLQVYQLSFRKNLGLIRSSGWMHPFLPGIYTMSEHTLVNAILTSAEKAEDVDIPNTIQLSQNYPNPFNPLTVIGYQLSVESRVVLKIYNLLGQEVITLIDDSQTPGEYAVSWDASYLPGGVYWYRLSTEHSSLTRSAILLK